LRCTRPQGRLEPAKHVSDEETLNKSWGLIKEELLKAERPLIWLGVEIDRFGLRQKARELVERLNIPFVTQLLSKAVLSEDHPLFAGVFDGQASSPDVQALATKSDFILALGVWLTDINTLGWSPIDRRPDFDKTAFASLDAVKYGTYFGAQVTLDDLIDKLLEVEVPHRTLEFPKPGGPAFSGNPDDPITYQGFYDFIQPYIDGDTIIGSDPSLNYFGTMLLKVGAERGYIAQSSYSSIGYIGPSATGLCLATENRKRVMVFTGDGGFQMSLQCVSTQTRFGLNAIIFVIDNGVFAVEQWLHNASVFSPDNPKGEFSKECVVHRWNYDKLSNVFTSNRLECVAWKVGTYGALKEAIEEAIDRHSANKSGPSIIQVVVPEKSGLRNMEWKENLDKAKEGN
jgi:indolepyruvate decarboxylase